MDVESPLLQEEQSNDNDRCQKGNIVRNITLFVMALTLSLIVPRWGRRENLSIAFAAGARNLAVIFAVLPSNVDPDMLVYFAAGQFPIYIMPAILKPIMLRLVNTPIDDKTKNSIPGGN